MQLFLCKACLNTNSVILKLNPGANTSGKNRSLFKKTPRKRGVMPKNSFYMQDILSADQFTKDDLQLVLSVSKKMKKLVETKGGNDILKGKLMTALFYEPSSRTYASF